MRRIWYQSQECAAPEELGIPRTLLWWDAAPTCGRSGHCCPGARAAARLQHIRCTCSVGEVRDSRCRRLARRLGLQERVHFTGFRSDAARVMRRCRAAVMPVAAPRGPAAGHRGNHVPGDTRDRHEKWGGMPELVRHEKTGLVVPPRRCGRPAQAILRLYDHPRAGRRLRSRVGKMDRGALQRGRLAGAASNLIPAARPGQSALPKCRDPPPRTSCGP